MRIVRIEAVPLRLPIKNAISFATGKLAAMEHVLVRIHTDGDLVGISEAPARPMIYGESVNSIVTAIDQWFGPALIGLEHDSIEEAWARIDRVEGNVCAKAAVDIAMHDLIAKVAGQPLWRLIGGYSNEVEVCHGIFKLGPPEEIAAEAKEAVNRYGFRWLKLKAGVDPERDTRLVAAVRKAVGDGVHITIDCNHGYASHVAEKILPAWRDYGVDWIEEPSPGQDVHGRARVAAVAGIPLMLDESAQTPAAVFQEMQRGVCSVLSIKPARSGISQSRKLLTLCELGGLRPVIGSQGDSEVGAFAAAQLGAAQRSIANTCAEVSFFLEMKESIVVERPLLRDGKLILPERPGIGVVIDEDVVARCRMR